ncbi:MAG: hypothetical protein COA79_20820 [Planctomycetota bacterium]|nr:MAG: hypothetical protein COA79_20820 [Planctomycetota bacterium]
MLKVINTLRILIVDDDEIVTSILENYISNYYDVTIFNCPVKALIHYSKDQDYSIVLADIQMPKLQGDEMIEEMLRINSKQKFIISTVSMKPKIMKLANTYSDHIFISDKPFNLPKLKSLLDKITGSLD